MRLCILCIGIMHIIGCHQLNSGLLTHAEKLLVYQLLLRDSMILQL